MGKISICTIIKYKRFNFMNPKSYKGRNEETMSFKCASLL